MPEPGECSAPDRGVSVVVRTLGCKVNQAESEQIAARLLGSGVKVTSEGEASVIVINTCTVTGEADTKARKAVRQALRSAQAPLVVVTGCLAAIDPEGLTALGDRVIVEQDKRAVAEAVIARLGRTAAEEVPETRAGVAGAHARTGTKTRAMVKIEDGCDAYCTYCIVPRARGVPRSTPLSAVCREVEALVEAGVAEVVLTGINLGRYSDEGADLADVLVAVAGTGVTRIRLSSIEPGDLNGRLLDAIASIPQVCPHLHVPLQAGDDGVLAGMGRGYTTLEYSARARAARAAVPGLALTTDVIAGFPGESDEAAARTAEFCEEVGFTRLHVFRYSARAGTPAAERNDHIEPRVRLARAARLRDIDRALRARHAQSRLGQQASVLVERVGSEAAPEDGGSRPQSWAEGTTEDYLRVRFARGAAGVGDIVDVRLAEVVDGVLWGVRPAT